MAHIDNIDDLYAAFEECAGVTTDSRAVTEGAMFVALRGASFDGNRFAYEMIELVILGPNDAEALEAGDWDLTLFTCTWGGAERITLRFEVQT